MVQQYSINSFKKNLREMCVEASMRSGLIKRLLGRDIWSVYDYMFSPSQLIFLTQCLEAYGIRTFDSAPRAVAIVNPAVMVANCAHPALIVFGPGGL